ncbi:MAG: hypothetical protein PHQ36_10095 [Anaerolineales bacterium]|nr:hypothetical protein [Anaerolineales bacterium]
MPESEAERLKRLRERQLRDRDPLANERKFQRNISIKEKRMQKPISLKEDWRNIPHVVKAPLFAFVLGIIGTIILVRSWDWEYAVYVGAGITIGLILFAAVLGNALDLRDKIKKNLQ